VQITVPLSRRGDFEKLVGQRIPVGVHDGRCQTATLQSVNEGPQAISLTFSDDMEPE